MLGSPIALDIRSSESVQHVKADIVQKSGEAAECIMYLEQLLDDNAAVRESSVVQCSSAAMAMLGSPIALNIRSSESVQHAKADIVQKSGEAAECIMYLEQLLDDNAAVRESSVVQYSSEAMAMLGSPIALNIRSSESVQHIKADIVQKSGEAAECI